LREFGTSFRRLVVSSSLPPNCPFPPSNSPFQQIPFFVVKYRHCANPHPLYTHWLQRTILCHLNKLRPKRSTFVKRLKRPTPVFPKSTKSSLIHSGYRVLLLHSFILPIFTCLLFDIKIIF
jgi:hypothetical protein